MLPHIQLLMGRMASVCFCQFVVWLRIPVYSALTGVRIIRTLGEPIRNAECQAARHCESEGTLLNYTFRFGEIIFKFRSFDS